MYQRQGAASNPINDPQKITELSFAKGASSFEDYNLEIEAEVIVDSEEAKKFSSEIVPFQDPLSYCVNQGLLNRKYFRPTCAGLLLFADYPQAHFPRRCGTKIVLYDTKQTVPEREHLKKNISVDGCIYRQFHQAIEEITAIMSSISILTSTGLSTISYPPEAIWEVVANAMIHRDYSVSDDVQITIFQNRIEVKSPGRLPGFVSKDNYLDVRYSRNPKIVQTLARYKSQSTKTLERV